jgi:hypothetical protein
MALGLLAAGCLALVVAACGGSSPSAALSSETHARSSTGAQSAIAAARCMRSHGVEHWPDPDRSGHFAKSALTLQRLGVTESELSAAQKACQHLFPNTGQSSSAQDQQMMNAMWKFARCVRARGVTSWPDPLAESDPGQPNTPGFPRSMPGVDENAPKVKAATRACQHFLAGIGYPSGGYP